LELEAELTDMKWVTPDHLRRIPLKSEETSRLRHPLEDAEWRRLFTTAHDAVGKARESDFKLIAEHIARLILQLDPLMTAYCGRTCPACVDPCCNGRKVFFNHTDLVFLAILKETSVPGQTRSRAGEPCRYLSTEGCRLGRLIRPYVCTWFLCEAQVELLQGESARLQRSVTATLQEIRESRLLLESLYEECTEKN
jgi:hypothetical protein